MNLLDKLATDEERAKKVAEIYFGIVIPEDAKEREEEAKITGKERMKSRLGELPKHERKILNNYVLGGISVNDGNVNLHLLSEQFGNMGLGLEDTLLAILRSNGIPAGRVSVEKVGRRKFISTAKQWEAILKRNLGYALGNPENRTEYAQTILNLAKDMRASDVHLRPEEDDNGIGGRVRFRIDGRYYNIEDLPESQFIGLESYLQEKVKPGLEGRNIIVDGSFHLSDPEIEYRLSSMITATGRKDKQNARGMHSIVIRLLKNKKIDLSIRQLGYSEDNEKEVERFVEENRGLVVLTGSTGVGKTTTIMSIVNEIVKRYNDEKNVITFEDPREYRLKKATQFEVTTDPEKAEGNLTLEKGLKNALRQDPDVIVVGEVRDKATADYVVQTSQSGRLVLTTLHSDDVKGAINRLAILGIPGAALNNCLRGIVAQKLIRRNCPKCSGQGRNMTEDELKYFFPQNGIDKKEYEGFITKARGIVIRESTGLETITQGGKRTAPCSKCEGLKYFERIPVIEIYKHEEDNYQAISAICENQPNATQMMKQLFDKEVNKPFAISAIYHLVSGHTTPSELMFYFSPSYFQSAAPRLIRYVSGLMKNAELKGKV